MGCYIVNISPFAAIDCKTPNGIWSENVISGGDYEVSKQPYSKRRQTS